MNDFNDKISDTPKNIMDAEDKLTHDMKKNDAEMVGRQDAMNDKVNSEVQRPSEVEGRPDQRPYNEGKNPSEVEGRPDQRPYSEVDKTSVGEKHTD